MRRVTSSVSLPLNSVGALRAVVDEDRHFRGIAGGRVAVPRR
jgi:hypothetical protein